MLTVYTGTDLVAVQESLLAYVDATKEKNPSLEVTRIETEQYEPGLLKSLLSSVSIFNSSNLYIFDYPFLNEELQKEILAEAEAMGESKDYFVIVEKTLLAAQKKSLQPHAIELKDHKKEEKDLFSPFTLAEALALRDKRKLWILLATAKKNNLTAEEIIGILWWQIKMLRLAKLTKSATEAGVKDYPYNKAKKALALYKPGQIEALAESLLKLYHDGHAGKRDIDLALEEWILRYV